MPTYRYTCLDKNGRSVVGTLDSSGIDAARAELRRNGLFIRSIEESQAPKSAGRRKIRFSDLALSMRELSTLLNSGLTLDESLSGIAAQMDPGGLRDMYGSIQREIREGRSFSSAASEFPFAFPDIFISMLKAGEASGTQGIVLEKIAQFMEEKISFRNKIVGVMTYPILMAIMGSAVLLFIFLFVAPTITRIFTEISLSLPIPTQILIEIGIFVKRYGLLSAILLGVGIFLLVHYFHTPRGLLRYDKTRLKIFFLRDIIIKNEIAHFTGTLGTLLESGVDILSSFQISQEVIVSPILKSEVAAIREMVARGQSLSRSLKSTTFFPYTVVQLISAGEKSGTLPEMLHKISRNFREEVLQKSTRLVTILEPVMILLMAVVVGFLVLGIMLPIFQISQSIR
jgi:type II secretory pathway component PulF